MLIRECEKLTKNEKKKKKLSIISSLVVCVKYVDKFEVKYFYFYLVCLFLAPNIYSTQINIRPIEIHSEISSIYEKKGK